MGCLKGIELENFKSYKKKAFIPLAESNFISIIGPNGSGKSNLMDAISFVLGIKSSNLRSSNLSELVNNSSQSNTAYVKAFYQRDGDDKETVLSRVIQNNSTIYKIDNKTVSFKEYSDWWREEKILIDAKNFLVFQGDVERIASQSPMELTKFIELISGSGEYKKEYDILKDEVRNLNELKNNSLKDKKRVNNELKIYKDNKEKNEQYIKNEKRRNELIKYFALFKIYYNINQRKLLSDKIKNDTSSLKKITTKHKNLNSKFVNEKNIFLKEEMIILNQSNKIESKQKSIDSLKTKLLPIELSKDIKNKKISSLQKNMVSLDNEIVKQKYNVKMFEKSLKLIERSKQVLQEEFDEENKSANIHSLSSEDQKIFDTLNEKFLSEGGSKFEEEIALLNNHNTEILDEIDLLENKINLAKTYINNDLSVKTENFNNTLSNLDDTLKEKSANLKHNLKTLKSLQQAIETSNNKEFDLNFKLREALLKIDNIQANKRESQKKLKIIETVSTLKKIFPDKVKGFVHDLCFPKKSKYELATSTILGRNFNSVIVDTLATANECIQYLKKQRSCTLTFIPLDTIEVQTTLALNLPSTCILAINTLEFDEVYRNAIQYVCSNSVVCDSLQVAQDLKWNNQRNDFSNVKLVTIDGSIIHKSGLMTGGVSKTDNNNKSWDKNDYQSLISLKDDLLLKIEKTKLKSRSDLIKSRDIEALIPELNTEITSVKTKIAEVERSLKQNQLEIEYQNSLIKEEYESKVTEFQEKLDTNNESISEIESSIRKLQDQVFTPFSNEHPDFSISDYKKISLNHYKKQTNDMKKLQKEYLNMENKLEFEKERLESTTKKIEKLKENIKGVQSELVQHETEKEEINSQIEQKTSEIEDDKNKLEKSESQFQDKKTAINDMKNEVEELTTEIQSIKRKIDLVNTDISKIDIEKLMILKNCKIDNIELPVTSDVGLDSLPIDKNDDDAILIANEIKLDMDELPEKYKFDIEEENEEENENDETTFLKLKDELETDIKSIEEKLLELQPNSRANDRYNEAKDRFNAVDTETEDLKQQERDTLTRFLKIKQKRKELFDQAFEYISQHIEPIYKELTKDPNSSLELAGGHASLTLEDEDEPFNGGTKYHATPPLKRFKDMEYLSGGEKTIAALALLFAINSYQPSPFFVLDEVDAALDYTNVERIAAYIKKHCGNDLQFIIISLKNSLFEKSESLVGVYRQQRENSSQVVTLNLKNYAD